MLTPAQAVEKAKELIAKLEAERDVLDDVRRYWTGAQALPRVVPAAAPAEVYAMARLSRVNVISIVMESLSQSLFVEGFRAKTDADNSAVWSIWQANRLDARQTGIHKAALAYGTSYAVVLPGQQAAIPVIRGASPRMLHAEYSVDDPDWPVIALEKRADGTWRLYDADAIYKLSGEKARLVAVGEGLAHNVGHAPVVRFREVVDFDLDDEASSKMAYGPLELFTEDTTGITYTRSNTRQVFGMGQIAPLMSLQDQVDVITFNLMVAEHFAAFRQRYILGWTGAQEEADADLLVETETEDMTAEQKAHARRVARRRAFLSATASKLWTFDDPDVKVGELGETNLDGYIKAREASLRHAASLSQTPAHELIGELVNLSAEALAAAEAGRDRKVADRQTLLGESHEQMLQLAGAMAGIEVPDDAQAKWRDTSARAFGAIVDGLVKLHSLGIPVEELLDRVPGLSQQDVERIRVSIASGDAFKQLADTIDRATKGAGGAAV